MNGTSEGQRQAERQRWRKRQEPDMGAETRAETEAGEHARARTHTRSGRGMEKERARGRRRGGFRTPARSPAPLTDQGPSQHPRGGSRDLWCPPGGCGQSAGLAQPALPGPWEVARLPGPQSSTHAPHYTRRPSWGFPQGSKSGCWVLADCHPRPSHRSGVAPRVSLGARRPWQHPGKGHGSPAPATAPSAQRKWRLT